jgi:type IV pilus assembly protein PilY1
MIVKGDVMINLKFNTGWPVLLGMLCASFATAQTVNVSEDFNSTTTSNPWFFFNGACLTASSSAASGSPGSPPGCTAIHSSYYGENLVGGDKGVSGSSQTLPDAVQSGALRFTNGCISGSNCSSGGHGQNGAIISGASYSSSAGIQITFKTATYRGDSGGNANDGADGLSFFLIDGSVTPNIGSWGGSLGYTCSNTNSDYHGMVGAYIGLGIDEYGNFLNGSHNTLGTSAGAGGDNTASGGGYVPNRIGMRGAGNIAWPWLLSNYPTYYGSITYLSTSNQQAAVQNTCANGYLSDYNGNSVSSTRIPVLDYPAIPNAYKVLTGVTIAKEYSNGGYARPGGTNGTNSDGSPKGSLFMYKLKITPDGFLSLSYSVNGGSWLGVLANQSITSSNGSLPSTIRFGFAGSTGGSSNIHEVLCFKAASLDTSSSSAATNLKQSAKVTSSSQAYFAFYDPNDWTGRLTANALNVDTSGNLTIASAANWDASCVLTGVASGSSCGSTAVAGPTVAEAPTSRVILSWNGTTGVPFEWNSATSSQTLTTAQQAALDAGDSTQTANRLNYLRGDRTNEVTTSGSGLFRDRDSVLGDIVDSSPTPVGQPTLPYAITWTDRLNTSTAMPENSGTQTYAQFIAAQVTRENIVYAGANDGMLHGFEAGAYNSSNVYVSATNDGKEVLAYMPAAVVNTIHNSSTVELDYANTQYGHNFYVDAPPGTGDLFYGGVWHTWLVGGLGAGGAAIYALDVTTPGNFSESNASSLVIGEWSAANLTCSNATSCANSLGNTYGTPVIRRLHNGMWAVIFGNGFGSSSGDAGIYVMTVDPTTAARTFYYLSTGKSGTNDGIAYVTAQDLDGDRITDYVYAGDLLGNVWRFDLTSSSPSSWTASSAPLFSAGSSHPITSSLLVAVAQRSPGFQVMVAFGTGQQTLLTNTSPTTYASGTQSLYAVWDWNFASWNSASNVKYLSLSGTATGLTSPYTMTSSNLTAQSLAANTSAGTVDITSSTICWAASSTCSSGNTKFGWSAALPGASEQIIYNPELVGTAFFVNSVIPVTNTVLACTTGLNTGYTYAIALTTGTALPSFFVSSTDPNAVATQNNATGTSTIVTTATNTSSGSSSGSSVAVSTGISSSGGGTATTASSSSSSSSGGSSSSSSSSSSGGSSSSSGGSSSSSSGSSSGGSSSSSGGGSNAFPNAPAGCTSNTKTWGVAQTTSGTPTATQINPVCPLSGQRVTWTHLR